MPFKIILYLYILCVLAHDFLQFLESKWVFQTFPPKWVCVGFVPCEIRVPCGLFATISGRSCC